MIILRTECIGRRQYFNLRVQKNSNLFFFSFFYDKFCTSNIFCSHQKETKHGKTTKTLNVAPLQVAYVMITYFVSYLVLFFAGNKKITSTLVVLSNSWFVFCTLIFRCYTFPSFIYVPGTGI